MVQGPVALGIVPRHLVLSAIHAASRHDGGCQSNYRSQLKLLEDQGYKFDLKELKYTNSGFSYQCEHRGVELGQPGRGRTKAGAKEAAAEYALHALAA